MAIEILYTVLPHLRGSAPRVSLLVSPRLRGGTTLADFDGFVWPRIARDVLLALEVEGSGRRAARFELNERAVGWWHRLFPATTPVDPWVVPDRTAQPIKTFPAAIGAAAVDEIYGRLAAMPGDEHPARPSEVSRLDEFLHRLQVSPKTVWQAPVGTADPWFGLLGKAIDFYAADTSTQYAPHDDTPPLRVPVPAPDFHQRLALLADHPSLLRELGLVLDLEVDLASLPTTGRLRAVADHTRVAHHPRARTPWTRYDGAPTHFAAAAAGDHAHGMLRFAEDRFGIYQTDIDGTLLKLAMPLYAEEATRTVPVSDVMPAIRTGAITVARRDRGVEVQRGFARSLALEGDVAGGLELTADDLTRGYRVDVAIGERWYSLCQRRLAGEVAGEAWHSPETDREGAVAIPGGTSERGDHAEPLRVHEAMFSWDGWSLVAPRPGRVPDDVAKPIAERGPFDLALASSAIPNTLPRLRYGTTYRLRARTVDLAGNSLPPDVALVADTDASPPITYLRREPIPTPVVVPRAKFTEGESLEHLVIRSAGGTAPNTAREFAAAPEMAERGYRARNPRYLAPPKATQITVETHGRLAPYSAIEAFWISAREQGALGDRFVINADATYRKLAPGTVQIVASDRPTSEPPAIDDGNPDETDLPLDLATPAVLDQLLVHDGLPRRGNAREHGQYVIYPRELEVPWLPDPMARGAALWGKSRDGTFDTQCDFQSRWPALAPVQLELVDGDKATALHREDVIGVELPPATMVVLRLSTLPDPDYLPHHAWWDASARDKTVHDQMERGHHWMISPWRELTFVHAVLKPLEAPFAKDRGAWQRVARGDTFATITGHLSVHGHSTSHVDLDAAWTDRIDHAGVDDPETAREAHAGHVAQLAVHYGAGSLSLSPAGAPPLRHDLGDTRRHDIHYTAIATTRYREYFAAELTADPAAITLASTPMCVIVKSSAPPLSPTVAYVMPTFHWSGDATHVHRTGRGLRVWLERPWWSSGDGELLGVLFANGTIDDTNRDVVTLWGSDPAHAEVDLHGHPTPSHLTNALAIGAKAFPVPGSSATALVAGVMPRFDKERGMWFADLELETGAARMPFVRLALCRWQPEALPGVELSGVVRADFVQVLPDRTATIRWTDHGASVIVIPDHPPLAPTIPSHARRPTERSRVSDRAAFGARPVHESWLGWIDHAYTTTAELQFRPAGGSPDHDLGWERVPVVPIVHLEPRVHAHGGDRQWAGDLAWPALPAEHAYRVVVRQYEKVAVDPGRPKGEAASGFPAGMRLVFAAVFDRL